MLKETIQEGIKLSLKEGKKIELSTLRMIISAINNKEKEKRTKTWKEKPELTIEELEKESQLTDEETLAVISSELKKRKEALLEYEKGGREDLAEKEKEEMRILQKYLPEQLSEEEIKELVKETIDQIGAVHPKDIGKVMAELKPKIQGRAEGGLVSKIAREYLDKPN